MGSCGSTCVGIAVEVTHSVFFMCVCMCVGVCMCMYVCVCVCADVDFVSKQMKKVCKQLMYSLTQTDYVSITFEWFLGEKAL